MGSTGIHLFVRVIEVYFSLSDPAFRWRGQQPGQEKDALQKDYEFSHHAGPVSIRRWRTRRNSSLPVSGDWSFVFFRFSLLEGLIRYIQLTSKRFWSYGPSISQWPSFYDTFILIYFWVFLYLYSVFKVRKLPPTSGLDRSFLMGFPDPQTALGRFR